MRQAELEQMNPWRSLGMDFARYDREMTHAAPVRFERGFPAMVPGRIFTLVGPRQVGKTTLIKQNVLGLLAGGADPRSILYISLDRLRGQNELREALTLLGRSEHVFLDEVSRLKGAMEVVKTHADAGRLESASMLLTGSSPAEIRYSPELAPGRGAEGNVLHLRPLMFRSFILGLFSSDYFANHLAKLGFDDRSAAILRKLPEVLKTISIDLDSDSPGAIMDKAMEIGPFLEGVDGLFDVYLRTGGFPVSINGFLSRVIGGSGAGEGAALTEAFVRDLMGDLSAMGKSEITLRRIVGRVLDSYGSRFSFQHLARDAAGSMAVRTVQTYLDFMEKSQLFHVLYATDMERGEPAFKKEKKVYFVDPFVYFSFLSYLRGASGAADVAADVLRDEEKAGVLVEGIVINHLVTHLEAPWSREGITFVGFHYDSRGREVDVTLKSRKVGMLGIEVRYGRSRGRKPPRKVRGMSDTICLTKSETAGEGGVIRLPVSLFLAILPGSRSNL